MLCKKLIDLRICCRSTQFEKFVKKNLRSSNNLYIFLKFELENIKLG